MEANKAEVTRLKEVVGKMVVMFRMSLGITDNLRFSCYQETNYIRVLFFTFVLLNNHHDYSTV